MKAKVYVATFYMVAVIATITVLYATEQKEIKADASTTAQETSTEAITETVETCTTEEETTTEEPTTEAETETEAEWTPYDFIPLSAEVQTRIKEVCDEAMVDYDLVLAIMWTESRYRLDAIGKDGKDIGGMQVRIMYWTWLANEKGLDVNDPMEVTLLGIWVLEDILRKEGYDLYRALQHYNTGSGDSKNGYADVVLNKLAEIERTVGYDI